MVLWQPCVKDKPTSPMRRPTPADVREFRAVDPAAEDLPMPPKRKEDQQRPGKDVEIAGMHKKRKR